MGNISYIVLEEELFTFFLNCGEIENVRLSRDPIFFSARLPV
jgi:RNA recognition motif-containing protein